MVNPRCAANGLAFNQGQTGGYQNVLRGMRSLPSFRDLRSFLRHLEGAGGIARIVEPVSVVHDMTEIHRRVLVQGGPALLFERPAVPNRNDTLPVLVNLFGTKERIAAGIGIEPQQLRLRVNEALT